MKMIDDDVESVGLIGSQPQAFVELTRRLSAGQRIVKLCGYAGTGKTVLLSRIAKWALQTGRFEDVTICAPTHKAAGVIKEKLQDSSIEVRTIHSLLGLRLEPDYTGDTGGRILVAPETGKKLTKGLVICDEASMIGKTLKEHIDASYDVTWLFVGDIAQLPPVGEGPSELLSEPDFTLDEVLRQAQGSEILNLATRIRQGDMSMDFAAGRDVKEVGSAEDLFQSALSRFDSQEHRDDPSFARMLVFRNARRAAINLRIREILIGSPEPYIPDEWLVMYAQFSPSKSRLNVLAEQARTYRKGEYGYGQAWRRFFKYKEGIEAGGGVQMLHVSQEVQVMDVDEGSIGIGSEEYRVHRLKVRTQDEGITSHDLPVLCAADVEKYSAAMRAAVAEAQQARKDRDSVKSTSSEWLEAEGRRRRSWQTYFTLEETFAQVDYTYAMTTHKSQGSTFDHVFVDVPDLLTSGGMRQQILYTAMTRPAKSLTFYK